MHKDFHYAVTYVVSRYAGFEPKDAQIIAYAAQYVDDSIYDDEIRFNTGWGHQFMASAHKMIDTRNLDNVRNYFVWVPFHFLPGNNGRSANERRTGDLNERLVCRENSHLAQDLIKVAIDNSGKTNALHRLGITMHVFADTWAHKGFSGIKHPINEVEDAVETENFGIFEPSYLRDVLDDGIPPLGHGRAEVLPDMPFLSWKYQNGLGETIERNNLEDFCEAAENMYIALKRFIAKDHESVHGGLEHIDKIRSLFEELTTKDCEKRYDRWIEEIKNGNFGFADQLDDVGSVGYFEEGTGSWKYDALGEDIKIEFKLKEHPGKVRRGRDLEYDYRPGFLRKNWKLFNDAVKDHVKFVTGTLLPRYGIVHRNGQLFDA